MPKASWRRSGAFAYIHQDVRRTEKRKVKNAASTRPIAHAPPATVPAVSAAQWVLTVDFDSYQATDSDAKQLRFLFPPRATRRVR